MKAINSFAVSGVWLFAAICAALPLQCALAQEAWKPEKALEIVVTCQPGCGPDVAARVMQRIMQDHKIVDVPVNVSNKSGGGGAVSYNYLHQKPGDAHSVVLSGANTVVNPILGRGIGYRELTPIALVAVEYVGIAVRPDYHLQNARELIAAVKKDASAVTFGIANSLGNANHQVVALALKADHISPRQAKNVVFQSGSQAITAMMGKHVDVVPASVGSWVGPRKSGQVRVISVSSAKRLDGEFSDVPTLREQGLDVVVSVSRTITGSPGLSEPQIRFWRDALAKTFAMPEWKRELDLRYQNDEFLTGPEFKRYLDDMDAQLRALLAELGLIKKKGEK
jgi:putative tricarboxylic transport membrane protein